MIRRIRPVRRRIARRLRRRFLLRPGLRFRRRRFLVGGMTMLLLGAAAYKLAQAEAERIQQHTGRPPEDLSPDELEQAMDELGIREQAISESDRAAIEAEADDSASWAPPEPAGAQPSGDYTAELEKLASLRDRGIITEDEFQARKKRILGL